MICIGKGEIIVISVSFILIMLSVIKYWKEKYIKGIDEALTFGFDRGFHKGYEKACEVTLEFMKNNKEEKRE